MISRRVSQALNPQNSPLATAVHNLRSVTLRSTNSRMSLNEIGRTAAYYNNNRPGLVVPDS